MEGWIEWVFGPGFRLYYDFFVISHSFLDCFICWLAFAVGCKFCMLRIIGGILGIQDDGKDAEEDGGRGEPRTSHLVAGEEFWWENGSHRNNATQLSGYVTGLGLSLLCIMPSTRLNNH